MQAYPNLNIETVVNNFERYIEKDNVKISRAEFEKNILSKQKDSVFNGDIQPLLSTDQAQQYQLNEAYEIILERFIPKLKGEPWQGVK